MSVFRRAIEACSETPLLVALAAWFSRIAESEPPANAVGAMAVTLAAVVSGVSPGMASAFTAANVPSPARTALRMAWSVELIAPAALVARLIVIAVPTTDALRTCEGAAGST